MCIREEQDQEKLLELVVELNELLKPLEETRPVLSIQ